MTRHSQIACDIGGTFTDVAVIDSEGRVVADKTDTTPGNLRLGMLRARENAAGHIGLLPRGAPRRDDPSALGAPP